MKRQDVHKPSAIIPEDYEFVAQEYLNVVDLGTALFLKSEREKIAAHMAHTGGTYSQHEHGGNCMVCGSVNAIYTCLFYHAKSNSYVRMGSDCTDKVYGQDFGAKQFRARVEDARLQQAGKRKAEALLSDKGLAECWAIYTSEATEIPYEERTIKDIVGKFVKYGNISLKAENYLRILLTKIVERPARAAKIAEQKANAADCPMGRTQIEGQVVTLREQDGYYGTVTKMLVVHATGYKVWGTVPRALDVKRGETVLFTATVTPSPDDKKFGFFNRPTGASVVIDKQVLNR